MENETDLTNGTLTMENLNQKKIGKMENFSIAPHTPIKALYSINL